VLWRTPADPIPPLAIRLMSQLLQGATLPGKARQRACATNRAHVYRPVPVAVAYQALIPEAGGRP
jgi:hypothetical protein